MDYKEKYEQALKRAREQYNKRTPLYNIESIFPELKESEDEKIRKNCIHFLELQKQHHAATFEIEECIAWLEKQVEHKKFRDSIQIGDKVTRNEDGVLVNLSQLKRIAKPAEEYNITGIGSKNAQGKLGEMIKKLKPVNEVFEQKSADKVEPKFKVGDWIITNKNHIWYVDETPETTSYLYRLINQYGEVEVAEFEVVDKKARLWTIEDIKNGDVLSYRGGQWIFIYKEKIDDSSFYYHTLYSTIHQDLTINDSAFTLLGDAIIPATKKQRDLLFQKMKEAGYEFDFGKKELKEIVQKPAAWSEEDESYLNTTIAYLKDAKDFKKTAENCINWLKSLKDRITWKPSEEQMDALNCARWNAPFNIELDSLYNDLKKLTE